MIRNLLKLIPAVVLFTGESSCSGSESTPEIVVKDQVTIDSVPLWEEEFTGSELGKLWGVGDWGFEESLCEFRKENLQILDGVCNLTISSKSTDSVGSYPKAPYWGAELYTVNAPQTYGRWSVRMKPSGVPGTVSSFFLANYQWSETYDSLLESSEIDIEFAGTGKKVELAIHYSDDSGKLIHVTPVPVVDLGFDASVAFHEWTIEVTKTSVTYFVDSKKIYTFHDPVVMTQLNLPMDTRINHWVSGSSDWVGKFDTTTLPITASYESIRYYTQK